ncbi:MAG: hypothetical protein M0Q26_02800 [Chitinophagaceae bacterium]|nr:hypothetical protein [Chitinophagaceae bacterium]
MSNFYLCHNPVMHNPESSIHYVYHEDSPRFFAGLMEIIPANTFNHFAYGNRNKLFIYLRGDGQMQLYLLLVYQNLDRATVKMDKALKEAVIWYCSALNMEDEKKYGKQSKFKLLQNYNLLTPGLQIVHLEGIDRYLLSYDSGVKSFDSPLAMDRFLSVDLKYTDLQLEEGNHNVFNPSLKEG